jgi:UDP-N-acetyl-D-mannosaminuronic acid dehydrogenase
MRGTPIKTMMPIFEAAGIKVLGHDPMVTDAVIREYGGEPVSLDKAFSDADGVLIINDHPDYRAIEIDAALDGTEVKFVYDSWRIVSEHQVHGAGARYAGLGYMPTAGVTA